MPRKLASLQIVYNVRKHPNADRLDIVNVLGWEIITQRNEFKDGDFCVFIECDAIVPDILLFEFMSTRKYRVKTQKLRGIISQGLAMPVSIIDKMIEEGHIKKFSIRWELGTDLTEVIGVKKYDPEAEQERKNSMRTPKKRNPVVEYMKQYAWFRSLHYNIIGKNTKNFPWFIKKTDEERIQNMPFIFRQLDGRLCYITEKLDGTSLTNAVFNQKKFSILRKFFGTTFYVCSRNLTLYTKNNSIYWKITEKEDIEKKLRSIGKNIGIQGEIIGESIQKNKYKLKGIELYIFNIIDLDKNYYYNIDEKAEFCDKHGFKLVPYLGTITLTSDMKVSDIIELSKVEQSKINPKIKREGIVIRPIDNDTISFKAINPEFLLQYGG